MEYSDIEKARNNAQRQIDMADKSVRDAARLSMGRLEMAGVTGYVLSELKKELKNFNASTRKWKD